MLESFPLSVIEECSKGNCQQCGLCCVVFENEVPSVAGDVESPLILKKAGEVCPQLQFDTIGRCYCLLHESKDHPNLRICREWSGEDPNNIVVLKVMTEIGCKFPPTIQTAQLLEAQIAQHRFPDITPTIQSDDELFKVIRHFYETLRYFSKSILTLLDLQSHVRNLFHNDPPRYQQLDRMIWECNPDFYHQFFHRFVWADKALAPRTEFVGP